MKKFIKKRTIIALLVLAVAGGVSYYLRHFNNRRVAYILVHDFKFGGRAKEGAIRRGDAILPLIQEESKDFELLNGRNSLWIADVLGKIQTERSHTILSDLYSRTNTTAKLTGAIGLAQHGALPDSIDEDSFLVSNVRSRPSQIETHLSIIALGWTKDRKALPCLLDLLKKRSGYWDHAYACQALARINSPDAIPVLRNCLRSDEFHALPSAFRTLIALGDRQAVPLAIARVTPKIKLKNSGYVVRELKKVTGKSYGYNQAEWQRWWDSVETKWQIPKDFKKPWDEQEKMY